MRRAARLPLAAALLALFAALPAHAEDVKITDEARQHFNAGVNLLKDPDGARYEEAYREFKAAYASSPSYKILGNLGLCAMKLERDGDAIDAYKRYLEHAAELDPGVVQQVKTDLATLESGAVHLKVKVNQPLAEVTDTRVPIRGERVVNVYTAKDGTLEIGIRPGHHVILVKANGMEPSTWELDASAGSTQEKAFELKAPEEAPSASNNPGPVAPAPVEMERPVPTSAYVGLAATGALLVGSGVVGAMALAKHSDYEKKNDGSDPAAAKSIADSGKTLNLVTDALLGATLVAGGITTYLFVSRPEVPKSDAAPRGTAFVRLSPAAAPSGAGLWLDGRF